MADTLAFLYRLVHVFAGAAWVGGAILMNVAVLPNLKKRAPPPIMGGFMQAASGPIFTFFMTVGGLTLASGVLLFGRLFGFADLFDPARRHSLVYLAALVLAAGALLLGLAVTGPTMAKLKSVMASAPPGPPPAEAQRLMARLPKAAIANLALLVLALALMVAGQTGTY